MAESTYDKVMDLAKRRGILYPAFDLYGGAAGFYDFGPLGAQLKANLEENFRDLYVHREGAAELQTPAITVEPVLRASGHLDHFSDAIVECSSCGTGLRGDHFALDIIEATRADLAHAKVPPDVGQKLLDLLDAIRDAVAGAPTPETIDAFLDDPLRLVPDALPEGLDPAQARQRLKPAPRCPHCGATAFGPARRFNLMFKTQIGPGSSKAGYLRPETAQAMFINFPNLYRYFREKLPFAAVQIGRAYRNEISPRQGLIRLREFNQMEVEAFFDPRNVTHPGWRKVRRTELNLVPNATGQATAMSIGDAVKKKIVANEALGYHLVLVKQFLTTAGIDPQRLRFRQHLKDEMAHYANDCWDAEYHTDRFGWIECVGVADRGTYDLDQHARASGRPLTALRRYPEPVQREVTHVVAVPAKLGPRFKKDAPKVVEALAGLDGARAAQAEQAPHVEVDVDGQTVQVPRDAYEVERRIDTVHGEPFTPLVIEPSYGTDRILYGVLEHNFRETAKDGEAYRVLALPPAIAPLTVAVLPLMAKDGLDKMAQRLEARLRSEGLRVYYDDTGTIGKRYARADEIGVPFCVTVDYDSLEEKTVTLRDRDTTEQWRMPHGRVHREVQRMIRSGWVRPEAGAPAKRPQPSAASPPGAA